MFSPKKSFILQFNTGDRILQRKPFTSNQRDTDVIYTVVDNDILLDVAQKAYNDDSKWFIIGEFNDIIDPFEIATGDKLVIPANNEY